MNKSYSRINWENYPSGATPIDEENLNRMDFAVDEIDNRVINMDLTKASKTEVLKAIVGVSYNDATGDFTFTHKDGTMTTVYTEIEKIAVNFSFNPVTQMLVIQLEDGSTQNVDLSALITDYEFTETDTIAWVIDSTGKVKANVKDGSITESKLRPNYLADIRVEVAKAEASKSAAALSETNARTYSELAQASSDSASTSADSAETFSIRAGQSETNALASANRAEYLVNSIPGDYSEVLGIVNSAPNTYAPAIKDTLTGTEITSELTANAPLQSLKMYGRSTQDGTPTPATPIEIKSIENPVVSCRGKNLFDKTTWQGGSMANGVVGGDTRYNVISDYVPVTVGRYVWNVTATCAFYDTNKKYISVTEYGGRYIDITQNGYVRLYAYCGIGEQNSLADVIQFEKGYSQTTYTPYQHSETTIPYTLRSIGDVRDEIIVNADGTGKLVQRIYYEKVTNSSGWSKENSWFSKFSIRYDYGVDKNKIRSNIGTLNWDETNKAGFVFAYTPRIYVAGLNITTLEQFDEFLATTPVEYSFVLEAPITTDLTAEQVTAIMRNLDTYKPTTVINNDYNADMEVGVVYDTKNYVDKKLAELTALALEGGI